MTCTLDIILLSDVTLVILLNTTGVLKEICVYLHGKNSMLPRFVYMIIKNEMNRMLAGLKRYNI
jgi:hypothetical protein